VFISLLKNQDAIFRIFHKINPLGRQISELYVARMGSMTKAMVRGQFIIATLQGLTDAALLYIGGIHTAFFFFAVVLIALSIIPLGGGILVLPIGVVMLLTGNIVGGLIVILGHLLIVTNIDNIMRPRLVPKEARLDPALTLLAVFSGVTLFGFIGIILGPVLMIVLVTTLQVYLEVFKGENAVQDGETQAKVSLSKRFGKFFASK
jgi:predicted PurR-regulated permease PerM